MSLMDPGSRSPRNRRTLAMMRETAWVMVLSIVVLYAFFVALGAFSPGEVAVLTVVVVLLFAAWIVHAVMRSRRALPMTRRDPTVVRARERRGF